jgi:hypothetical protein
MLALVLAAITRFLCSRILGARDWALGAAMTTRGAAVGGVGTVTSGRSFKAPTRQHSVSSMGLGIWRSTGSTT